MADELLPCPFCGGEGLEVVTGKAGQNRYKIVCSGCGVKTFETVASPLHRKAWNTRSDVPSREALVDEFVRGIAAAVALMERQAGEQKAVEVVEVEDVLKEAGFVRERTCHPERPMLNGFRVINGPLHCSQCGTEWDLLPFKPAYCPACGAKVVRDE